ncbi:formyltransferase family protein [Pelagibacteraceae bacterium]|nr:formyltransferase family protein [Pelagibacteraceae bacterium]
MKHSQLAIFTNSPRCINVLETILKNNTAISIKVYLLLSNSLFNEKIKKKFSKKVEFIIFDSFVDKNFRSSYFANNFDFLIIPGFPKLIPNDVINHPKYGSINLHAGKLPKYRGGSPLNWQIINGETEIGISCIIPNSKFDQGNVLAKGKFFLKPKETIKDAHLKANKIFPNLVKISMNKLLLGSKGKKQASRGAGYFKQRKDQDGKINLNNSINTILNLIRAITTPYPGAFLYYNRKKIRVYQARKVSTNKIKKNILEKEIGKIVSIKKNNPIIICKNALLEIKSHNFKNKFILNSFFK